MEQLLDDSDSDWTVFRPAGLFGADLVSSDRCPTGHEPGGSTSTADLADALRREAVEDRNVGHTLQVLTDTGPHLAQHHPLSIRARPAPRPPAPAPASPIADRRYRRHRFDGRLLERVRHPAPSMSTGDAVMTPPARLGRCRPG